MSSTFSTLGLSDRLVDALAQSGVTEPFPVQESAIPSGLSRRDIQCEAPTGSGKTLAFGLPMISNVASAKPKRPRGLILAPTRELAEQIRTDLAPLARAMQRRVTAIYGGVAYGEQRKALRNGVDILVATPGRLEDLISQGWVDLSDVDIVTIDEADRMADMGFLPAVRRILRMTRENRQTLLFSATLDGDVGVLARESQNDPERVVAGSLRDPGTAVVHRFMRVENAERTSQAAAIISDSDRTIVFTRTRHGADRLVKQLAKADISAVSMHGGRSQNQRTRALQAFSSGRARALVATDVAARGIHVEDIDVVLHYDMAKDPKDYVHRSGRTARAGAGGTVITLVIPGQEKDAEKIRRATGVDAGTESPDVRRHLDSGGRRGRQARPESAKARHPRPEPGRARQASPDNGRVSLYVGNLPWSTSARDLEALFATHGPIDGAQVMTDRKSGRSKGYGFVEIPMGQVNEAIRVLDRSDLDGRRLRVRLAR